MNDDVERKNIQHFFLLKYINLDVKRNKSFVRGNKFE